MGPVTPSDLEPDARSPESPGVTPPDGTTDGPDRTTRQAALWATVVAVPLAVLVGLLAFGRLSPDQPVAGPSAVPSSQRPQASSPVTVPAPALAERPAVVCRALLSRLPATVRDLAQRPVTEGAEQNAAYGEPPLVLACGVPGATVGPTDDLWQVNGVCWHTANGPDRAVLTTVDREVPVRVTVPAAYQQPLQWVAPLSESMVAAVPAVPGVRCGR